MPTPAELLATAQTEGKELADTYNRGQQAQNELMTKIIKKQGEIDALNKVVNPPADEPACEVSPE
tara:strand:+ start:923 stop:1117 length:195 start_codon:yes stop_codon:yes gene_type:complete